MPEARLPQVQDSIREAAEAAGRHADEVTLVAVGKTQPVAALRELYDAGHRDFGENRAQELLEKAEALPADARWHYLGRLQRNKLKPLHGTVHLLQSFHRPDLAEAWAHLGKPSPPVLLQVNVGREPQKQGVLPENAREALEAITKAGVACRGLMCIPPYGENPQDARPFFRELRRLRDALATSWPELGELSMGMTHDFEVAIQEGATIVRVGTGLFGERGQTSVTL